MVPLIKKGENFKIQEYPLNLIFINLCIFIQKYYKRSSHTPTPVSKISLAFRCKFHIPIVWCTLFNVDSEEREMRVFCQ